jgi:P27 family predicted phage terminase small subunit
LNAYAKEEWQHIAPELHRLGLLTVLDVGPLAAYCAAAARLRQAEEVIGLHDSNDGVDWEAKNVQIACAARNVAVCHTGISGECI